MWNLRTWVGFASLQRLCDPAPGGPGDAGKQSVRASERARGRGLSRGSCRLKPGRKAPLVTAPHETLMPGFHSAISRHLEPKRQPQRPVAIGGHLSGSCPPGWSPDILVCGTLSHRRAPAAVGSDWGLGESRSLGQPTVFPHEASRGVIWLWATPGGTQIP